MTAKISLGITGGNADGGGTSDGIPCLRMRAVWGAADSLSDIAS